MPGAPGDPIIERVRRIVVTARLAPGAEEGARGPLAAGPPFDPGRHGSTRHADYVGGGLVVFAFEADGVERRAAALFNDPVRSASFSACGRCSRSSPGSRTRRTTGRRRRTR